MVERRNPPKIKMYEALGLFVDGRVSIDSMFQNQGVCFNPVAKKQYSIQYDEMSHMITSSDGTSSNEKYLGAPALAFLLKIGKLLCDPEILPFFKKIEWEEIKKKSNKEDEEALRILLGIFFQQEFPIDKIENQIENLLEQLKNLHLKKG